MALTTYYDILNVSPCASDEDVRRAYRAQALRWHPDRNPRNRKKSERIFMQINHAYTILKTQPQRNAYNRALLKLIRSRQADRRKGLKIVFSPVRRRAHGW